MKEIDEKERRSYKIKEYNTKKDIIGFVTNLLLVITIAIIVLIIVDYIRELIKWNNLKFSVALIVNLIPKIIIELTIMFTIFIFKVLYIAICDHIIEKLYTEEAMDRQTQCLIDLFGTKETNTTQEEFKDTVV